MDPPGEAGNARRERSLRFGQATLLVVIAVVISCCGFGANALRPRATSTATATSGTAPITGSVVLSADRHTIYYTDADGTGTYGEQIVVDPSWIAPIPDGVGFPEAATLSLNALTAAQAL
ncbi:MAG TPA: hypothetical protein VE132_09870, partial [Micromonosporaceae bacterium]|nr:hypothetical protein [Micromonosporaceae bacterium]